MSKEVFIGTYTKFGDSKGIYKLVKKAATWSVGCVNDIAMENPTYLLANDDDLYTIVSCKDGSGGIAKYSLTGNNITYKNKLLPPNSAPCHLTFDQTKKYIITSHYHMGKIDIFKIENDNIKLLQTISHKKYETVENPTARVHYANFTTDNKYIIICDLGLDKIFMYPFAEETGILSTKNPFIIVTTKGAGPRHFTFNKTNDRIYVLNELSSTVSTYTITGGKLQFIAETNPFIQEVKNNSGSAIKLHPNGEFLYTSQRGKDVISCFKLVDDIPILIENIATMGRTPRDFAITSTGKEMLVANQESNTITVFEIETNGKIKFKYAIESIPYPVCIYFREK